MRNEHLIKKIKEITKDLQNLTFNEKRQTVKEEISKFEHTVIYEGLEKLTVIYEGLEKLLQINTPNEQIELLENLIGDLEGLLKKIKKSEE